MFQLLILKFILCSQPQQRLESSDDEGLERNQIYSLTNAAFTASKITPQTNTHKEHTDVIIQLSNKSGQTESIRSGSGRNQIVWHLFAGLHAMRNVLNSRLPYPAELCAISIRCWQILHASIHTCRIAERTEWKKGKQKNRIRRKMRECNVCRKYLQQIFNVARSAQHRRNQNN